MNTAWGGEVQGRLFLKRTRPHVEDGRACPSSENSPVGNICPLERPVEDESLHWTAPRETTAAPMCSRAAIRGRWVGATTADIGNPLPRRRRVSRRPRLGDSRTEGRATAVERGSTPFEGGSMRGGWRAVRRTNRRRGVQRGGWRRTERRKVRAKGRPVEGRSTTWPHTVPSLRTFQSCQRASSLSLVLWRNVSVHDEAGSASETVASGPRCRP